MTKNNGLMIIFFPLLLSCSPSEQKISLVSEDKKTILVYSCTSFTSQIHTWEDIQLIVDNILPLMDREFTEEHVVDALEIRNNLKQQNYKVLERILLEDKCANLTKNPKN